MLLRKQYKHFQRYQEIVRILGKHGFGFLVRQQNTLESLRQKFFGGGKKYNLSASVRIRLTLEELGVTFIKIGQFLSTRPDLLPTEWIEELSKLQDQVPPFPFTEARNLIQAELGCPLEDIFASIETEPLAVASIGQVHRAVLHAEQEVVIKVQRPSIEKTIKTDLEILFDIASLLERHTDWAKMYNLKEIVLEFEEMLAAELNYLDEGHNMDIFRRNLGKNTKVCIPEVFWEYTTKKVLTMAYMAAVKLTAEDTLSGMDIDMEKVAVDLSNAVLKQIFVDGVFHGDLHPGNIMLLPDGQLVLLDFGSIGIIDEEIKEKFGRMLVAQISRNTATIIHIFLSMGIAPQNINRQVLQRDIEKVQHKYYGLPFSKINIGEAIQEFINIAFKHNIRLPAEFVRLSRTLAMLEGLVAKLAPHTSLMELAEPFGKDLLKKRLSLENFKKVIAQNIQEYEELLIPLPRKVVSLVNTLENGQFKIMLEHKDLGETVNKANHMINRLAFSIVLASLIVGLSLILQRADRLIIWGIPIAEVGFVVAGVMGFWLLVSILRSGKT